jgi:NDP-sugar pyrophosphorylase family protein
VIEQAVVLCAGRGTRLGDITKLQAKPLTEVAGKPFICWFLDDLVSAGIKDIVLLVGYLKNQFNYLTELYPEVRLVESNIVVNKGVLGIKNLDSRFLLSNGDCYPIFRKSLNLENLLESTRRLSLCVKEKVDISIGDAGLATVDRASVEMGLLDCSKFSSMRGILADFFIEGNLHINDLDGLKGAETWLSGKISTVTSLQHSLMSS